MKRLSILMLIAVALLTACIVVPPGRGHRSEGVMIAPILPSVVVLEAEPYYYYSDYHYHYDNDRWYYSKSRKGPWAELPRDRYPKEVRFKGKGGNRDRGRYDDQRDGDRDYDYRR
ncbi:MAG: hypothetical protein MUO63_00810 [Desulfobulbaceae bacterium]|nr:hypothetical protein [Desulfobulbaceae bacterium]